MDWVGAAFNPIYTDLVPQLQSIFQASEPGSPEYALSQVVWVLGFHRVTDYWGPIPYFNAGVPGKPFLTMHRIKFMMTSLRNLIQQPTY